MKESQFRNLYYFLYLYNGIGGEDIFAQSEDYLLEKYNKLIGIDLPNTSYKKILDNNTTYIKYKSIWGHKLIPDSLMMFLCETFNNKTLRIKRIYPIFEMLIGSINKINEMEYEHIHPKLKEVIIRVVNENILTDTETIRDININYIIS